MRQTSARVEAQNTAALGLCPFGGAGVTFSQAASAPALAQGRREPKSQATAIWTSLSLLDGGPTGPTRPGPQAAQVWHSRGTVPLKSHVHCSAQGTRRHSCAFGPSHATASASVPFVLEPPCLSRGPLCVPLLVCAVWLVRRGPLLVPAAALGPCSGHATVEEPCWRRTLPKNTTIYSGCSWWFVF